MSTTDDVLQWAGPERYAGPLLHDRYQVLESAALKGQYYLSDNKSKTVVRVNQTVKAVGEIIRFDSIKEAEDYAAELAGQKVDRPVAVRTGKAIVEKGRKVSGDSAASMFRRLILAGGLTDDEIFKKVQEKFGLADNRRSYVEWYRKELQKKGEL